MSQYSPPSGPGGPGASTRTSDGTAYWAQQQQVQQQQHLHHQSRQQHHLQQQYRYPQTGYYANPYAQPNSNMFIDTRQGPANHSQLSELARRVESTQPAPQHAGGTSAHFRAAYIQPTVTGASLSTATYNQYVRQQDAYAYQQGGIQAPQATMLSSPYGSANVNNTTEDTIPLINSNDVEAGGSVVDVPIRLVYENAAFHIDTRKTRTYILDHVTGCIPGGAITAIMGPSGCGKTTLLNYLSGRLTTAYRDHVSYYCGETKLRHQDVRWGFVPQEDVLLPHLTCRENLEYSAQLRLPKDLVHAYKEIVQYYLTELEIDHVADNIVGGTGKRGISGGQKRRVNIGVELVAAPSVLFLDEPTSGLDSRTAQELMNSLDRLRRDNNITIAMVIHQPRYEIFKAIDFVIVLNKRHKLDFQGTRDECEKYYAHDLFEDAKILGKELDGKADDNGTGLGGESLLNSSDDTSDSDDARSSSSSVTSSSVSTPASTVRNRKGDQVLVLFRNPADCILDKLDEEEAKLRVDSLDSSAELDTFKSDQAGIRTSTSSIGSTTSTSTEHILAESRQKRRRRRDVCMRLPPKMRQFHVFLKRGLWQQVRYSSPIFIYLVLALTVGAVIGGIYHNNQYQGPLPKNEQKCPAEITCDLPIDDKIVSMTSLLVLGLGAIGAVSALELFGSEEQVHRRERAAGLSVKSYYAAKLFSDLPRTLLMPLAVLTPFYIISTREGSFFVYYIFMLLVQMNANTIGYIASIAFDEVAAPVASIFIVVMLTILSGGNPILNNFNSSVRWITASSYARWVLEGIYIIETNTYSDKYDTSSGLTFYDYSTSHLAFDFIIPVVICFALRMLAYMLLYYRHWINGAVFSKVFWWTVRDSKDLICPCMRSEKKRKQQTASSQHRGRFAWLGTCCFYCWCCCFCCARKQDDDGAKMGGVGIGLTEA